MSEHKDDNFVLRLFAWLLDGIWRCSQNDRVLAIVLLVALMVIIALLARA